MSKRKYQACHPEFSEGLANPFESSFDRLRMTVLYLSPMPRHPSVSPAAILPVTGYPHGSVMFWSCPISRCRYIPSATPLPFGTYPDGAAEWWMSIRSCVNTGGKIQSYSYMLRLQLRYTGNQYYCNNECFHFHSYIFYGLYDPERFPGFIWLQFFS